MDLLVSVVIPVYNVEKYLDRCVRSAVDQTYKNLEIILVDDGSPDNCPAMCDEWAKRDSRIKVIHKQNAGLGMARNTGIENANGKYIFFFDSDDYVDISIVAKCVRSAEKYGSEAVVYGRCDVYDNGEITKRELNASKELFTSEEITKQILPAMFTYDMGFGVSAWGKMFSLDVIKKATLRFVSEREIISEDAYFMLIYFSKVTTVSLVKEPLYFYYKRGGSLSRSFKADRQLQNDIFLQKSLDYIEAKKMPEEVITHLTARYHMFSIAAMKQVVLSNLSKSDRKNKLREIYRDDFLRNTIRIDVLRVDGIAISVLMVLIKLRLYFLCDILLKIKTK